MEERVESGVYRHYKGGLFSVIATAIESTNARVGVRVVVYMSLTTGRMHVRSVAEFKEFVDSGDARFERIETQP